MQAKSSPLPSRKHSQKRWIFPFFGNLPFSSERYILDLGAVMWTKMARLERADNSASTEYTKWLIESESLQYEKRENVDYP